MANLNIRNVDEALLWSLNRAALERKLTLRDWVISALSAQCLAELGESKAEVKERETGEKLEGENRREDQTGKEPSRVSGKRVRELRYEREE